VLKGVPPQIILTHELVDRIYPVSVAGGTVPVAHVENRVVRRASHSAQGGSATFLGFRPCDNQSCSLGYDTAHLVRGAQYPRSVSAQRQVSGRERQHRGSLANRRLRGLPLSQWRDHHCPASAPAGRGLAWRFGRDAKADAAYVANHPMPTDKLELKDFKVNGHW